MSHHTLKFYSGNRRNILRFYMFFAAWTRLPLLGRLARRAANAYGRSLHRAYLLTPAEALELVHIAGGVALAPCDCRRVFHHCDNPMNTEILLGPTRHIIREAMTKDSREITVKEAEEILGENHKHGLIFTIIKCRGDFYAICSCCSCCCVPLRLSKQYGIGEALVRHQDIVKEYREFQSAHAAEDVD
jgi:hypothetical protein